MRYAIIGAATVCLLACSSSDETSGPPTADEAGDAAATGGDSSSDAAGPALPAEPVVCGVPEFSGAGGLRRYPYLQSVHQESARIAWTTTTDGDGAIELAPGPDGPWTNVASQRELFHTERTREAVDYWAHEVRLTGLEEGRSYCYRVLEGATVIATGLKFTTAWNDPTRPLRVLAFGDSGKGNEAQMAVRDAFMKQEFDLFLHLGDMAYEDGTFEEFHDHVFSIYKDFLHKTPTWPTMGNHEFRTSAGQPYLDVYYLPEQAVREEEQERYYSFDYGDVHFACVDSNEASIIVSELYSLSGEPNMFQWLREDLAASDKPWKVAFFHHPPFSSSERDPNQLVRDNLLPILEEGGVDLVLTGHDHHTERTVPMWQEQPSAEGQRGIHYIVAGAAGAGLRTATGDFWTAFVDDQNHSFVTLTFEGCTLTGQAVTRDSEVTDSWVIDGCNDN